MQYIYDNGPDGNPSSLEARAASTDIEIADDVRMKDLGHGQQSIGTKVDQQADDTSRPSAPTRPSSPAATCSTRGRAISSDNGAHQAAFIPQLPPPFPA